ncbi:MAG: hypothetical protein E7310_05365 [Clostridiales bacterium]|nr:hypothetical protein [Clostridiales bacterium]
MSFNIYTAAEVRKALKAEVTKRDAESKFSIRVAQMVDRMYDYSMRLHFIDFNTAIPDFFNSEWVTKLLEGTGFAIREREYEDSENIYYLVITDATNDKGIFGHSPKEIYERYKEAKEGISDEEYTSAREWLLHELEVVTSEMSNRCATMIIPEEHMKVAEKGLFREDVESYGYTYLRSGNEITIYVSVD